MKRSTKTNIQRIAVFNQHLDRYEASVVPNSNIFTDYTDACKHLHSALVHISLASESDTHSMMRILAERVLLDRDGAYSEFTILMSSTVIENNTAQGLIMGIAHTLRCIMEGQHHDFNEAWFKLINNNVGVHHFLKNYHNSDLHVIEHTYSGNVIRHGVKVVHCESLEERYSHELEHHVYELFLSNRGSQVINFTMSPHVRDDESSRRGDHFVIESEVRITARAGCFYLDKEISFLDDAMAQLIALGCAPNGVVSHVDTLINLADDGYSCMLGLTSYNSGETWRVNDVQMLPPRMTT